MKENQAMVFTFAILSSDQISLNYVLDEKTFTIDSPALQAKGFVELLHHEMSLAPSFQA